MFLPKIDIEIQISRDSDLNIERFKFESQNYIVKNLAALHRQVSKCSRAGVVLHLRSPSVSPRTESKLRGVAVEHLHLNQNLNWPTDTRRHTKTQLYDTCIRI